MELADTPSTRSTDGGPRASLPVTVVVLTLDEGANLEACLASVGPADRLVVVDSGSTDDTLGIARRFGAQILQHPFASHARQWRWAIDQLPDDCHWVLGLDADQRLTSSLRAELIETLGSPNAQRFDGFYLRRRQIFMGRWLRHGGYYPVHLLKLFKRSSVRIDESDLVDHHFYISGPSARMTHDLVEDNRKEADLTFWLEKHVRYAERQAMEEWRRRDNPHDWPLAGKLSGSPDERTIWFKRRWYRLPLYIRPALYFAYRYFFRLGFLDGREGFAFHFLQGFWYRMLVDIHLDRLRRAPPVPHDDGRANPPP